MRVIEAYGTSEKLVEKGLLCEIVDSGEVIAKVRIRPADLTLNLDFRRETAAMALELQKDREDGIRAGLAYFKLFLKTVIVDIEWVDPADKKDPKLKFTEENMVALFISAPKFFAAIEIAAGRWKNYKIKHEKDITGN